MHISALVPVDDLLGAPLHGHGRVLGALGLRVILVLLALTRRGHRS